MYQYDMIDQVPPAEKLVDLSYLQRAQEALRAQKASK